MRSCRLVILAGLCALGAPAQYRAVQPLGETDILFARAKAAVVASLSHLPDFTCVETIERSQRLSQKGKFRLLDNVRLEVALVNGKELFAWPGASKFEERSLREMVSGTIGTGDFALHAKNLYLAGVARFRYQGLEELDGRRAHKFHFRVPLATSTFRMRVGESEAVVGYQGHTWHDATTFELLRIDFAIDEIPTGLPLMSGHKRIDYARVEISGTPYMLPSSTEMTLAHLNGTENRNRLTFSGCRQYQGASTLVFDEPPAAAPTPAAASEVTLAANLDVPLKLVTPIDLGKVAIGESVVWSVAKNVQRQGRLLIPRDARVEMRVDHFACTQYPVAYCFLGLAPGRISFANQAGDFRAELTLPELRKTLDELFHGLDTNRRVPMPEMGNISRGTSVLVLRGTRPRLPSGLLSTWRTL